MQAELAFRPTRADIDDLSAVVGQLRADLLAKEQLLERLQAARDPNMQDKAVETSASLEDLRVAGNEDEPGLDEDHAEEASLDAGKISAEIDEMFRLDYEDDDEEETDSVATELEASATTGTTATAAAAGEPSGEYARLEEAARLRVTLGNGSLHALEEELVAAKERWAEVCGERARLAAQLAALQTKRTSWLTLERLLAIALPLLAAALAYLLLPAAS